MSSSSMGMMQVPDGEGGFIMRPAPIVPKGKAKKAARTVPDPLENEAVANQQLRLLIERVERLEEDKSGINDDIRDVYGEAKSQGYDAKIMRRIVRLRKLDPHTRQEEEAILETYKCALGLE